MQVLIVDKSALIIQRLEELLSDSNAITLMHKAFSYEEASQIFVDHKPEMVVMDNNLPRNGSFKLLNEIKFKDPATIVVILSIHLDINKQQLCLMMGADYFFDKYHEFEKIPGIVHAYIGKN